MYKNYELHKLSEYLCENFATSLRMCTNLEFVKIRSVRCQILFV